MVNKYAGIDVLKWIKQIKLVRDVIDDIETRHKNELSPYKQLYAKLSGTLLEYLDATNQESARTDAGTAYVSTRTTASLVDSEEFMEYIKNNSAFDLLERRANATACKEFAEKHGVLPPGVKLNVLRSAHVRSSD